MYTLEQVCPKYGPIGLIWSAGLLHPACQETNVANVENFMPSCSMTHKELRGSSDVGWQTVENRGSKQETKQARWSGTEKRRQRQMNRVSTEVGNRTRGRARSWRMTLTESGKGLERWGISEEGARLLTVCWLFYPILLNFFYKTEPAITWFHLYARFAAASPSPPPYA